MINLSQSLDPVGHSPPTMVHSPCAEENREEQGEGIKDVYLAGTGMGISEFLEA